MISQDLYIADLHILSFLSGIGIGTLISILIIKLRDCLK